jgi:hypothetical protein
VGCSSLFRLAKSGLGLATRASVTYGFGAALPKHLGRRGLCRAQCRNDARDQSNRAEHRG